MEENQLKNEVSMRGFLIKKYLIDLLGLLIILFAIGVSRWLQFIDNATLGATGGLVIGYYFQDVRKIHTK